MEELGFGGNGGYFAAGLSDLGVCGSGSAL